MPPRPLFDQRLLSHVWAAGVRDLAEVRAVRWKVFPPTGQYQSKNFPIGWRGPDVLRGQHLLQIDGVDYISLGTASEDA